MKIADLLITGAKRFGVETTVTKSLRAQICRKLIKGGNPYIIFWENLSKISIWAIKCFFKRMFCCLNIIISKINNNLLSNYLFWYKLYRYKATQFEVLPLNYLNRILLRQFWVSFHNFFGEQKKTLSQWKLSNLYISMYRWRVDLRAVQMSPNLYVWQP